MQMERSHMVPCKSATQASWRRRSVSTEPAAARTAISSPMGTSCPLSTAVVARITIGHRALIERHETMALAGSITLIVSGARRSYEITRGSCQKAVRSSSRCRWRGASRGTTCAIQPPGSSSGSASEVRPPRSSAKTLGSCRSSTKRSAVSVIVRFAPSVACSRPSSGRA